MQVPAKEGKSEKVLFIRCSAKGEEGRKVFQGIIQDVTERNLPNGNMPKARNATCKFSPNPEMRFTSVLYPEKLVDCNRATSDLLQVDKDQLLQSENIHHYLTPLERTNEFLLKLRYQRSVRDFEIEVKERW
ncbi:MAG: hypothetical protein R2769_10380 [Saprospiraceae bacterium]